MNIEQEFYLFLKERKGLHRLFDAWITQYERLGYAGGSVVVENVKQEEMEAIGTFLGCDLRKQKQIHIYWRQMQKAMDNSRFSTCNIEEVFTLWKGKPLRIKKEERRKKEEFENKTIEKVLEETKDTYFPMWWELQKKQYPEFFHKVKKLLLEDKETLLLCIQAIEQLPYLTHNKKPLAVFAAEISKDPHFFDKGMSYQMLYKGICYRMKKEEPNTLEEKNKLFYDAGLIRDDISNYCMLCHINAEIENQAHAGWNGFFMNYETWNVSLWNLSQIDKIKKDIKKVYILENPSVYRMLCEYGKKHNINDIGFLCTSGQLNLCAYILLDMLVDSKIQLYYSGDFDPEGIQIADKLKQRYKENIVLWHYEEHDYRKCISNKTISERRLLMLRNIKDFKLIQVSQRIEQEKRSGYQEKLIDVYKEDLSY